jgi:predicted phosphoribosyltransferase
MKKVLASLLVLFVLMIGLPLTAEAHAGCYRHRKVRKSNVSRTYASRRYVAPRYRTVRYAPVYRTAGYTYKRPSFYRRHRNVINVGVATGAGALIGGIAKGKRGAGVGALVGAGSGALYTYVLNKKKRRY